MAILIYRSGGLGDHIITLPLLQEIRKRHRTETVVFSGDSWIRALLARQIRATPGPPSSCIQYARLFSAEKTSYFDRFSTLYVISRRPRHIHPDYRQIFISSDFSTAGGNAYRQLLQQLASTPDAVPPYIAGHPRQTSKWVMLHIGSGGRPKTISRDSFIKIAQILSRHVHVKILYGEAEKKQGDSFPRLKNTTRVYSPDETTLLSLFAATGFYIGCDSGVSHLAAALDVPGTALFTVTQPRVWAPENRSGTFSYLSIRNPADRTLTTAEIKQICDQAMGRLTVSAPPDTLSPTDSPRTGGCDAGNTHFPTPPT